MFTGRQRIEILKWCGIILISAAAFPVFTHAELPEIYNLYSGDHNPKLYLHESGSCDAFGYIIGEKHFRKYIVKASNGIELYRFAANEEKFYMSDKGFISADSDLLAISIYHSRKESLQKDSLAQAD